MVSEYLTIDHLPLKDIIRIFPRIYIDSTIEWNGTPCWIWTGLLSKGGKKKPKEGGYGLVYWKGRNHYIHRVFYAWLVEPAPPHLTLNLDHLCRRRACANPTHLEPVPGRINILRGVGRTAKLAAQTHCKRGHLLPVPDKRGERICRICRNTAAREHRRTHYNDPNGRRLKYKHRYNTDPEFRAKEVQYKRDRNARLPPEIKREQQRRWDAKKRAKKKSLITSSSE